MSPLEASAVDRIVLASGDHPDIDAGGCVMEWVSWLADEPHSDKPECVARSIDRFMINLNDSLPDDLRQQLLPLALVVIGTNTGRIEDERRRAYLAADWAVRDCLPLLLDRLGELRRDDRYAEWARRLRAHVAIVDVGTANSGRSLANEASGDLNLYAYAAYAYAAYAAYAAADAAAYADAAAAAYAAAAAAAYAYPAAYAAAYPYAYAAAYADAAARRRMCEVLLPGAIELVRRMAEVGRATSATAPQVSDEKRALVERSIASAPSIAA